MLFLVDLITKPLQAGRIGLNSITKRFRGCKIRDLRQKKTSKTACLEAARDFRWYTGYTLGDGNLEENE